MPHQDDSLAAKVEAFVRDDVVRLRERSAAGTSHGPTDELIQELRAKARAAGVLTPHILADGSHLTQRETAMVLQQDRPVAARAAGAATPWRPTKATCTCSARSARPSRRSASSQPLVVGRGALGLLHDRAGGRGRRRLRSVDDEDDVPARRQSLGDQRPQGVHHRRRGRQRRHRHGEVGRRRAACSWSTCPTRRSASSACSTRSIDSMPGGHADGDDRQSARARRPDARRRPARVSNMPRCA